jgi:hypothetical protein
VGFCNELGTQSLDAMVDSDLLDVKVVGWRLLGGPTYCSSISCALGKDDVGNLDEFKKLYAVVCGADV